MGVFDRILKGLRNREEDTEPKHLLGPTLHNMGVIEMWQGHFSAALERLEEAVEARKVALWPTHPDVAVSLCRKGMCHFALREWDHAIADLEEALSMCPVQNATRAKVLNNLGVVHYHRQDKMEALKYFASALTIQRKWLEGRVQRESIVYDASITLSNMGKLYLQKKDFDTAFHVFEESLVVSDIFSKYTGSRRQILMH